jgi:hypothetical protein
MSTVRVRAGTLPKNPRKLFICGDFSLEMVGSVLDGISKFEGINFRQISVRFPSDFREDGAVGTQREAIKIIMYGNNNH